MRLLDYIVIIITFFLFFIFKTNDCICQTSVMVCLYDTNNRLIQISYSNGDKLSYTYDEVGNRISANKTHPTSKSWIGVIDENWDKPGNWSPFGIPQATDDATIPASAPFMPAVKVQGLSCNNVFIAKGASLLIQLGLLFTINGTLTLEGE